jgi:CBS-domain-containing membrane protein
LHDEPGNIQPQAETIISYDLVMREAITAFAWESCRTAAERMAQHRVGRLVVVAEGNASDPIGMVTRSDLLSARAHLMEEELRRERFIGRRRGRTAQEGTTTSATMDRANKTSGQ